MKHAHTGALVMLGDAAQEPVRLLNRQPRGGLVKQADVCARHEASGDHKR